jgi:MFS family permease
VVGGTATVLMLATGSLVYGLTVVFDPIQAELGASTLLVSLGFGLRSEVGGLAAPLVGSALDRVGPTPVVRTGVVLASSGCLLLSFTTSFWHFVPAMLLIAVGTTASGGQVGNYAAASWFRVRRARAMSLMTLGGAAGGLFALLMGVGVDSIGWRSTLRLLAVVILVGGLGLSRFVRARPAGHPEPIDGFQLPGEGDKRSSDWEIPWAVALRSRAFKMLIGFNLGVDFSRLAYLTHLANFVVTDLGATAVVGGGVVTASTISSVPGRLLSGFFADRLPLRFVAAATMAPFLVGIALLAFATEPWHAFVAASFGGIGFGASVPVRPALYVSYFGLRAFGKIMGIGRLASTTGGFLGSALVGLLVDRSGGDYTIGWLVTLGVCAVAMPVALLATPPVDLQRRYAL